ncbi:MAG: hypothetical protein NVSMB18_16080 [Acetobacteraceae bacterium]
MNRPERPHKRILHQIVGRNPVAGQEAGEAAQVRQQRGDLVTKLGFGYVGCCGRVPCDCFDVVHSNRVQQKDAQ